LGKVFSNKDNFGHLGKKNQPPISRNQIFKKKKTLEKKFGKKWIKLTFYFFLLP